MKKRATSSLRGSYVLNS